MGFLNVVFGSLKDIDSSTNVTPSNVPPLCISTGVNTSSGFDIESTFPAFITLCNNLNTLTGTSNYKVVKLIYEPNGGGFTVVAILQDFNQTSNNVLVS